MRHVLLLAILAAAAGPAAAQSLQDAFNTAQAALDAGRGSEARAGFQTLWTRLAATPDARSALLVRARLGTALRQTGDPQLAAREFDALLLLPADRFGGPKPKAMLHALRGRVDLNAGRATEALNHFLAAAEEAGGTNSRQLRASDVRIRGDLALGYWLAGRTSELAKLTYFSGQGQLAEKGFRLASRVNLPSCLPDGQLAPDAMAIIEFAIADDGRTFAVSPVYATPGTGSLPSDRPEEASVAAVRGWAWSRENVAKLDPFWRQSIRVELRCFDDGPGTDQAV